MSISNDLASESLLWTFAASCSNVLNYLRELPQSGRGMPDLEPIQKKIIAFRSERDWAQFHDPKNLAEALFLLR